MQAEIQSTNYIVGDPNNLQAVVIFTDNEGNQFNINYTYPIGGDPLDQINNDIAAYQAADVANQTALTDIQTALTATPNDAIAVSTPVMPDPIISEPMQAV